VIESTRIALVTDAWLPQVNGRNGLLHDDLKTACLEALGVDRGRCREWAERHSWRRCAGLLLDNLAWIGA
jgi:hypothetical protein